jgi:DNA-binding NarL/FixJ family response regulator
LGFPTGESLLDGMNPLPHSPVSNIVILREDRFYAEAIGAIVAQVFPGAKISLATTVQDASRILTRENSEMLITGVAASIEGDVVELLMQWIARRPNAHRVMVVTADRQYRMMDALRRLGVHGVFDSSAERPGELSEALRIVGSGGHYWSPTLIDFMTHSRIKSPPLSNLLTAGEQVILSIVGDGSDDITAARQLGISPATVSTVRRDLHRKLGVQHRGELIRIAAQNGYVQFTPHGVTRPGFALFSAEYYARRSRRSGLPPSA